MCARTLENYSVYFYCSGIDSGELEQMFFHAFQSLLEAIDEVIKKKAENMRVLVLTKAVSRVPRVLESESDKG